MAQRSISSFKTTKDSRYADNTSGGVSAEDSRNMFEDTADSFLNITDHLLDEDDMASNSATKVASQQSIKAYVDSVSSGNPDLSTRLVTDFLDGISSSYSNSAGYLVAQSNGVFSTTTSDTETSLNAAGVAHLGFSSSASAFTALIHGTSSFILGTFQVYRRARLRLGALSDGSNHYTATMGVMRNANTTMPATEGVFFRYSHDVNSGKWQAVCVSDSTETATDTGITADTSYHIFEITVNQAGGSVSFEIDGAVVATVTTNIPTESAEQVSSAYQIWRTAGSITGGLRIDWDETILSRTTAR